MTRKLLFLVALVVGFSFLTSVVQAFPASMPDTGSSLVAVSLASPSDIKHFQSLDLPLYAHLTGEKDSYFITDASAADLVALAEIGLKFQILEPSNRDQYFYVAYVMPGRPEPVWEQFGNLLIDDGFVLLKAAPAKVHLLAERGVELRALSFTPKPFPPETPTLAIPEDVDPDPAIQALIDQVYSNTVYAYTGSLSGEWPVTIVGSPYTIQTRYTYSGQPIHRAVQYTRDHFSDLGLSVEVHQWADASNPNVIAEIQGTVNPDDVYIIGAHLDDMPSGSFAPGADDNASGSAAVMIAADILSQYEWGCTLRFALWTGEEQGLYGSNAYAARSYQRDENILGVLNLDMIAWNTPSSARRIDLHANANLPQTLTLARLYADVLDAYNLDLIPQIIPNGTGFSDHASFWNYGFTALLAIEDLNDFNPYYHTTQDQLDKLDMSYFTEFVKASVGTFAHLSNCLIPKESPKPTWNKGIWVEGDGPYTPANSPFDVYSGSEIALVDHVAITATSEITYTQSGNWSDALQLYGWEVNSGIVTSGTNTLAWSVEGGEPGVTHTITRTYQVSAENWVSGTLTDTLWVAGADPQPDPIEIGFNHLLPEINLYPGWVHAAADPGEVVTATLAIQNVGGVSLDWSITGIGLPGWLDIGPVMGSIQPGDEDHVILTFDAAGLVRGQYITFFTIESNDPIQPTIDAQVIFMIDPWWMYLPAIRH